MTPRTDAPSRHGPYSRAGRRRVAAAVLSLALGTAVAAPTDDREALLRLARTAAPERALEVTSDYLSRHPGDREVALLRGVALFRQDRLEEARRSFEALTDADARSVAAWNNLAAVHARQGRLPEALEALQAAIRSRADFATAQDNLNRVYAHMAADAYSRVLADSDKPAPPELHLITALPAPPAAPAPAPAEPAQPAADEARHAEVRARIEAWLAAWEAADVAGYLDSYAPAFTPADAPSRAAWEANRRARLDPALGITLSYRDLDVVLDPVRELASAEFIQHYQARHYADTVRKQLRLRRVDGRWLITAERELEKLD